MKRRIKVSLLVVALAFTVATAAFAAPKGSAQKLIATYLDNFSVFGVQDDGNPIYEHGVGGVQAYYGVGGKDVDIVTYNTTRKLRYTFDTSSTAFVNSGIGAVHSSGNFLAISDLFGINYWGRYRDMGIGTTAQVQSDLEFYVGNVTYELDYASLACYRKNATTWLFTTDPADIPGDPGFQASKVAKLNVIRRKSVTHFGTVDMPMRFEVTLK
ncbi:MAG: hypothetical protein ACRD24_06305 [Terriglobales bacterium]